MFRNLATKFKALLTRESFHTETNPISLFPLYRGNWDMDSFLFFRNSAKGIILQAEKAET